ncbi:MAG: hypothetical protein QM497_11165 [Sulfurimonas sp.]
MKLLQEIQIKDKATLIYGKLTLKNILKRDNHYFDESFLLLAFMELSLNLLKHGGGGSICFFESDSDMFMASKDNGNGIKDITWAVQNGTTRMQNSLGLGLYQMNHHDYYHIEIASFTSVELHGTIVLLKPRKFFKEVLSLQKIYIGERVSGDMIAKKGRFLLLADGSGHGKAANKSVERLKSYFYDTPLSCIVADDFFTNVHTMLQGEESRGVVLSVFEILKSSIQVCGVGNIAIWVKKNNKYESYMQKEGILGEAFSKSDSKSFAFESKLIGATDGIAHDKMSKLLSLLPQQLSSAMIALSAMHFASVMYDDKSIVVISKRRVTHEQRI